MITKPETHCRRRRTRADSVGQPAGTAPGGVFLIDTIVIVSVLSVCYVTDALLRAGWRILETELS